MTQSFTPYQPRREGQREMLPIRGGRYRIWRWPAAVQPVTDPAPDLAANQAANLAAGGAPWLVMLHGWMDVGASFQFLVDAMHRGRGIVAADWRGFGQSAMEGRVDSYWFPDYLGDLDALLDHLAPGDAQVDLLGHSMGGNVVMSYAGLRPRRVRRLINLEGFGLPASRPDEAPARLRQWLDELKTPMTLRDYASQDEVAQRLRRNNPRLSEDKARWLAPHWAQRHPVDGRWVVAGDPAHKRVNPTLYQRDEVLAIWREIQAPLLWVEGRDTDVARWWGERYPRSDFEARLAVLPRVQRHVLDDCGHMLHHDQPQALARLIDAFLDA